MKTFRLSNLILAPVLALALLLPGLNGASAAHSNKTVKLKGTIKIGQITSLTGPFALYGLMEQQGFKAGLAYATGGTNKVLGAKIQVTTVSDVAGAASLPDPATAVSEAKTFLEQDKVNFIQCCASSGSAAAVAGVMPTYNKVLMVAPAAADAMTGINRDTFRTSREDSQDAKTGAAYAVKSLGKDYMTIAQNYSFGQNQENVWNAALKRLGANDMGDILFPLTATDFTPYIQQVQSKHPKWLFLACAGTQCTGLFNQLASSGLLNSVKVMTGLPDVASIAGLPSEAATKMAFMSVYYYTFPKTKANDYLKKYIKSHYNRPADIFHQDTFAAAQMLVAAIKKAKSLNTSKLIKALEGLTVHGPKGDYTIRKQDHLAMQPMYIAKVVMKNGKATPVLLKTLSPKQSSPPVQAHNW